MDWIFHGGVRRAVACVDSIFIEERRRTGAPRSDTAASGISACYGAVFVRGGAIASLRTVVAGGIYYYGAAIDCCE